MSGSFVHEIVVKYKTLGVGAVVVREGVYKLVIERYRSFVWFNDDRHGSNPLSLVRMESHDFYC